MEKNKIGAFHFVTEPYQLDFQGRMTIPMIGSWLMRAASVHASQRGFGFSDMTERHTAWVLSRLAIEMNAYPIPHLSATTFQLRATSTRGATVTGSHEATAIMITAIAVHMPLYAILREGGSLRGLRRRGPPSSPDGSPEDSFPPGGVLP